MLGLIFALTATAAFAQMTEITYQGRLTDNSMLANASLLVGS